MVGRFGVISSLPLPSRNSIKESPIDSESFSKFDGSMARFGLSARARAAGT